MFVGICKLDLRISACRSLKEKRRVLRMLKDRTMSEFSIVVSEVGCQDLWQRSELGFAVVGPDRRFVEGLVERAAGFLEGTGAACAIDRYVEIISV
jgi:uncharacterized protein YlxP (DUF503 family)